jgi:predicted molibdopterin-dependent oxidoreductase YjgC
MTDNGFTRIAGGIQRGKQFSIQVDGQPVVAFAGETVAAALLASGRLPLRHTEKHEKPRGIFCGMGICFDCLMTVNGMCNVRTCITPAEPGMIVTTQYGLPRVSADDNH